MEEKLILNVTTIKNNIEKIKDEIKKYSPHPEKVQLVAVTKYFDETGIEAVIQAGHNIVGENKGQQVRDKERYFKEQQEILKNMGKIDESESYKNIKWHFIGNLQSNKVKYIVEFVELVHSINRLSVAQELDRRAKQCGRVIPVLLEINIAGEESKEGYKLEELINEIEKYKSFENIKVKGLMTMAPNVEDESIVRDTFRKLRETKDLLNEKYFGGGLTELSMGMSGDYKIALEEGATIIRIGTKLFKK